MSNNDDFTLQFMETYERKVKRKKDKEDLIFMLRLQILLLFLKVSRLIDLDWLVVMGPILSYPLIYTVQTLLWRRRFSQFMKLGQKPERDGEKE